MTEVQKERLAQVLEYRGLEHQRSILQEECTEAYESLIYNLEE